MNTNEGRSVRQMVVHQQLITADIAGELVATRQIGTEDWWVVHYDDGREKARWSFRAIESLLWF